MNTEIKAHFCSFSTLRMRYVAAYLLAALGGTENPEAKDIKKILESVGVDCDDERLSKVQSCVCLNIFPVFAVVIPVVLINFPSQQVISELSGKNVNDVIASGERGIVL